MFCPMSTPGCYYGLEALWEKRKIRIISHPEKMRIMVSALSTLKGMGGGQVNVEGIPFIIKP